MKGNTPGCDHKFTIPVSPLDRVVEDAPLSVRFPHYHKDVSHLKSVDVYRVLKLFDVTDPCLQHAIKKLLVAGNRSGGKSFEKDINEAVASLNRLLQMIAEDDVIR